LTEPAPRALPGTEGALDPFFSPDGAWVAFASPADLKLKKIALAGGGPTVVADLPGTPFGLGQGTWTADGMIVFGELEGPVRRVPAAGGVPEVMVPRDVLEGIEIGMIWPAVLPGGKATVFETTGGSDSSIAMYADGKRRTLVKDASQPRWSPTGHVLSLRLGDSRRAGGPVQSDLVALAFDATRAEPTGSPVAVLSVGGALRFDLSRAGTLLYTTPVTEFGGERVTWVALDDRPVPPSPRLGWNGELATTSGSTIYSPRLSPTGGDVLYFHATYTLQQLMVVNPASGHQRIFATGGHYWAIWTPDGRRVIYQEPSGEASGFSLAWKPIDGSAAPERLTTKARGWQQPQFVTRDGRYLVYQESGGLGAQEPTAQTYDLWLLPLEPRGEPRPLLRTKANERLAHLSTDQRWMAYVSDETGRSEVWVRSFPEGPVAIQVSQEGGTEPVWAPDGRTLYYRDAAGTRLFAVPVTGGAVPQFGTPSVTTGWWEPAWPYGRMYDITADGRALLMPAAPTHGRELKLVLNFDEVIRRKMAEVKK
jgi:serine/threonine-protein kinase